ncbi:unnamed protein product, partial [marine sediment metagenome]
LKCEKCINKYPIINGIPRLCIELNNSEKDKLKRFEKNQVSFIKGENELNTKIDYVEIEKIVRQKMSVDSNSCDYLKAWVERNIEYKVWGCEKEEKYVKTLKQYYHKPIEVILDIGGGSGGLIKCFSDLYTPILSIMLDYDLDWAEVAKLRNPNVDIVRGDATNLPFKRNSIDLVISQAMLEHIKDYDNAIKEMCEVAKNVSFIAWNPNKLFVFDFGHLDAPVAIFPKKIAKYIAIWWHRIRRTGRTEENIIGSLNVIHYISTVRANSA